MINEERLTTGERIRRLRRQKGWTQLELGRQAGVRPDTLSRWETDASWPQMAKLFDVARCLGVSMDYLQWGPQ